MSTFDKLTKGEPFFIARDKELDQLVDPETGKVYAHLTKKINCLLCQSPIFTVLFTKNGFDYVRCRKCKHVYVNPQLDEKATLSHYDDKSKTTELSYNFISSDKQQEVRGELFRYFFNKIQPKIPHGKILDIGCSIGQFLGMGKALGYDTLGLELNEATAKYAEEKNGIKVERKLLHECNFPDNSFEIVSLFGVIEHLTDPVGVIKDIHRILKPGGMLIGICPNVQSLVCMALHELSRTFTGRLHLSYFSDETLRYLFNNVGFSNEKINIDTCYTGKDSLLNYFQFLDPFGEETTEFLPEKFKKFISQEDNIKMLEEKMNELGIGLKLRFIAEKK